MYLSISRLVGTSHEVKYTRSPVTNFNVYEPCEAMVLFNMIDGNVVPPKDHVTIFSSLPQVMMSLYLLQTNKSVHSLCLDLLEVSDEMLEVLGDCPNITELNLSGKLTKNGVEILKSTLSKLKLSRLTISLSCMSSSDEITVMTDCLSQTQNLTIKGQLDENETDTLFGALATNTNLVALGLFSICDSYVVETALTANTTLQHFGVTCHRRGITSILSGLIHNKGLKTLSIPKIDEISVDLLIEVLKTNTILTTLIFVVCFASMIVPQKLIDALTFNEYLTFISIRAFDPYRSSYAPDTINRILHGLSRNMNLDGLRLCFTGQHGDPDALVDILNSRLTRLSINEYRVKLDTSHFEKVERNEFLTYIDLGVNYPFLLRVAERNKNNELHRHVTLESLLLTKV